MTWLQAAKERAEKATPGPWIAAPWSSGIIGSLCRSARGSHVATVTADSDKLFVSHARADLPRALALLEEAERLIGLKSGSLLWQCERDAWLSRLRGEGE